MLYGEPISEDERWKGIPKEVRSRVNLILAAESSEEAESLASSAYRALVSDEHGKPRDYLTVSRSQIEVDAAITSFYRQKYSERPN